MVNTFYSTMSDSTSREFDKLLELRDGSATAISATTAESAIAFPVRKTQEYKVCYNIGAYSSYSVGVNSWSVAIEVSDTSNGTYVPVATINPVGSAVTGEVPLTNVYVAGFLSTAEYIRVKATKTGSPGSLSYGAFITYE